MTASAAAALRSEMAVGTTTASIASTPSSAATSSRQTRKASVVTAGLVSTGPVTTARGDSSLRSLRRVAAPSCTTCRPWSPHASAASAAAPPVLEMIATRLPRGSGWQASSAAVSMSSPRLVVATMPACSNRASWVASGVAATAVCEAARWPAGDRAPMTVSTGIRRATRRAVPENLRGLPNDSTYRTAIWVTSSCAHQVSRLLGDTSYLSPTEANEDTPMPSLDICSSSAIPTPPDCTTMPATPRSGWSAAKVASRPIQGMMMPKQSRPDQPHAVLAADGQQFRACGAQSGSYHYQCPDPVAAALRSHYG